MRNGGKEKNKGVKIERKEGRMEGGKRHGVKGTE